MDLETLMTAKMTRDYAYIDDDGYYLVTDGNKEQHE